MDRYFQVNAVLSLFSKNYMELKKDLPIRPSEMGVLNIITETGGTFTPAEVAKMLHVSKPMITAHISVLRKKGYISKEPSSRDGRVYYIVPTDKARELVESTKRVTITQLSELEAHMGQDNFEAFVRFAEWANAVLEKEKKRESGEVKNAKCSD